MEHPFSGQDSQQVSGRQGHEQTYDIHDKLLSIACIRYDEVHEDNPKCTTNVYHSTWKEHRQMQHEPNLNGGGAIEVMAVFEMKLTLVSLLSITPNDMNEISFES